MMFNAAAGMAAQSGLFLAGVIVGVPATLILLVHLMRPEEKGPGVSKAPPSDFQ